MTYTGSGLVYNGLLLGTSASGQPATFSSTAAIDPSSSGPDTSIAGPGVDAMLITPGELRDMTVQCPHIVLFE
jgi:hypothetical protein